MKNLFYSQAYRIINTFISIYLIFFLIRAFTIQNIEFIGYMILFVSGFVFSNLFLEKILKRYIVLYGLISVFILFHILGGVIYFGDIKMYDYYFFGFFRYDWFMHLIGGMLCARISYEIVKDNFLFTKDSYQLLIVIIIILAVGIGVFNELIEFMAVIFLNASKAVGDYYNNLTDICNNLIGSIIYLLIFSKTHKFRKYEFEKMKYKEVYG